MEGTTKIWRDAEAGVAEAGAMLAAGGIVAFPTETVYGLGADARNPVAVERVFAAKGRPSDNPLIVHIADRSGLEQLTLPAPATALRLMDRHWPGPLTLVLAVRPGAVAARVTAGLDTVAVRMPAHGLARRLIAAAGCPIAAPSANRSGRPSPTTAAHVREDLDGRIDGLLDGGPAGVGLESTVVQVDEGGRIHILRPGGVTSSELAACGPLAEPEPAGSAEDETAAAAPRSPGVKYKHYAPSGAMRLVEGAPDAVRARIQQEVDEAARRGARTGVLAFAEHAAHYRADLVLSCGSLSRLEEAASGLYAALRAFDAQGVTAIWAEAAPRSGIGEALMNRLEKASGQPPLRV
ncbi:threonylcarbamoyl-AMP synthase [Paenibacillus sp. IB182496]|uniref:Threonylcarbamoyl-AMP synthase n=1 Tax=Paenibacillus sabuli TaxID=2772509 RepID=A0A927BUV3_9BACL|nr:L-threonylcarbamoyladenylate synthase [Paenibacillus sabuli]MBD2845904.1 threonylcarbamoyl-AMP synthase [Paenibacillus sabuli]